MTKITIAQLIWDEWNTEHIKKHAVLTLEAEEAVLNAKTHQIVKNGRILLIGRVKKRIISVILVQVEDNKYYIITARDAAKKERRQLYDKENK